jgi:hypothetical protein
MQIHILEMVRKHNNVLGVGTGYWQKIFKKNVFKSNTINTGLLKKDIVLLRPIHA